MLALIGRKIGMTQLFNDEGMRIPVSVIKVEPNVVVRERTEEKHGYQAMVLGADYLQIILPYGPVPTNPPAHFDADGFWVGMCFIPADESVGKSPADSWTVLEFDAPQPVEEVRARIRAALTPALA